jgi:hypothetical protein
MNARSHGESPGGEGARSRAGADRPALRLLLEVVPGHGGLAHIPELPGLCFRIDDLATVQSTAFAEVARYAGWLRDQGAPSLSPVADDLARRSRKSGVSSVEILEMERRTGAPVWLSGNPAALFEHDRKPMSDVAVSAHMRFVQLVVTHTRALVAPLSGARSSWRRAQGKRSIDDTLAHIGDCVWWYCSRIDDDLPEPEERRGEPPLQRIDRLLEAATAFLLEVPFERRAIVHVPRRIPSKDQAEEWTHAKVCRRQAEHVWEHLSGLRRAVDICRAMNV